MKKFILNYTDGYNIKQIGCFETMDEAQAVMRQQYRGHQSSGWLKGLSELNETSARLYDNNVELHIWSITTMDVPRIIENNSLIVKLPDGHLIASIAQDPHCPGIDVEFVANTEKDIILSRPRVLIEQPFNDKLRCLIWDDSTNEDYTEGISLQ